MEEQVLCKCGCGNKTNVYKGKRDKNAVTRTYIRGHARRKNILLSFWEKVDKSGECWEWISSKNIHGYGQFYENGKHVSSHRFSWRIANGEIPEGLCVLHKCDNRKCVRPDHLFLGTYKDNHADMNNKGRGNKPKGENHIRARLKEVDVLKIREEYKNGEMIIVIARKYNVHKNTISSICHNKIWKHLLPKCDVDYCGKPLTITLTPKRK